MRVPWLPPVVTSPTNRTVQAKLRHKKIMYSRVVDNSQSLQQTSPSFRPGIPISTANETLISPRNLYKKTVVKLYKKPKPY